MDGAFSMNITFKLALFSDKANKRHRIGVDAMGLPRVASEKALLWALEALVNINRDELRRNPIPKLYRAGVRYKREETEVWKDVVNVYKDKEGDCEDLGAWRVAELRNDGKWAKPFIRYRVVRGNYIYHVMVDRRGGILEDPSKRLGMAGVD